MNDIENRADIDELMRRFYQAAIKDKEIGYIFTEIAKLDLDAHLPVIGDFWESLLLGRNVYQRHGRNPLQVHGELNEKTPLKANHFQRWLELFRTTIDSGFQGERADFMKSRAEAIANRMMNYIGHVPEIGITNPETTAISQNP